MKLQEVDNLQKQILPLQTVKEFALTQLQEKLEKSDDETRIESKRVKDVNSMLGSLMDKFHYDQNNSEKPRLQRDLKEIAKTKDLEDIARLTQKKQELEFLKENIN
ncbi:hypothetical protein JHK84_027565 [Glycine max]|nr:hypothetical protein JHK85_027964 [Glycine max]KAG5003313.1 hypothetical protein JHK86_027452 [Glycine max]KAG5151093.1 hypothetical protein JHK84_027565 [Glycine max]